MENYSSNENLIRVTFFSDYLMTIPCHGKSVADCFNKFLYSHEFTFVDYNEYDYYEDGVWHMNKINWEEWL